MIDPNDDSRTWDRNNGAHHGVDNEVLRRTIGLLSPPLGMICSSPLDLDWGLMFILSYPIVSHRIELET